MPAAPTKPEARAVIRDRIKSLRRVPASKLKPNPKNWRRHPKRQREAMRAVLEELGYADTLLAREKKNGDLVLIDGHLRQETTPDQKVPVLVLDLSEKEADKLLATLDPLAAMAEADRDTLEKLLGGIETEDEHVRELLDQVAAENQITLGEPEEPPDLDRTPTKVPERTKLGETWLLGGHRVLVRDVLGGLRELEDESVQCVVTSPPYWGLRDYGTATWEGGDEGCDHKQGTAKYIGSDGKPGRNNTNWQGAERHGTVKPGNTCRKCGARRVDAREELQTDPEALRQRVLHSQRAKKHEQVDDDVARIDRYGETTKAYAPTGRNLRDVWTIPTQPMPEAHFATFPAKLVEPCLKAGAKDGAVVLDPFMGSGTVMVVAETLGMHATGIELNPKYADIALRRWEELTKKKAKRAT